ncbi:MAG: hypothetical protein GEV28_12820 [Actinophytocola sp.]|uniref:ArsR/SmtB family transcription factor n=1 Tax=Actinophytocola sp. TaxID=1872138 RepID=UPI00132A457B|nr:hypothetical protein [Actinophytocola sp.]MPZ81222.1 hypothetical protein [Actinophytocola sp.]
MDHDEVAERRFDVSRALDNRVRLAVLCALAAGDVPVADLVERMGGTVPGHLTVLRAAGLVDTGLAGRVRLASLHVVALLRALDAVASVERQPSG